MPTLQKIGTRKLSSLYIFVAGVQLYVFTLSGLAINLLKDTNLSLTSVFRVGLQKFLFPSAPHTRTRFRTHSYFFITTSALAWLFGDCLRYLCINSISIFYKLFNYVTPLNRLRKGYTFPENATQVFFLMLKYEYFNIEMYSGKKKQWNNKLSNN